MRSAIYQRLQSHYGPRSVFMDVERMQVARDFRDSLQEEVSTTDAMLVLIGPDWERLMIERGGEEADFVRIEIEVALSLDKPVLPILLGEGTPMLAGENVPESIRPFTFNHRVQLDTGRYFKEGMERLIQDMDEHLFAGMARYRPKPKLKYVVGVAASMVALAGVGWYFVTGLHDSEQRLVVTQKAVDDLSQNAEQIESNTAQIAAAIEQVGVTFEELSKSGGVIEQPVIPHEFYHNARIFELRGDYANARKAFLGYFQFDESKLDPHLRYLDFLKIQEGREGARETYALIANLTNNFIPSYAAALLWDRERRITLLGEFEKAQPGFAPVYYHLSLEYSADRVGAQSIEDQRLEKTYLEKFREHDEAGKLVKYFIDQEMVTLWREDVERRLSALESMVGSLLDNPVNLTWTTSGSGWHEDPDLEWAFLRWDKPGVAPVSEDVEIHRIIPKDTQFMTVRLSFKDGTVSETVRFER